MIRRVVAGLLLGLIVLVAASIVSRGRQHPEFLKPDVGAGGKAKAAVEMTASLQQR